MRHLFLIVVIVTIIVIIVMVKNRSRCSEVTNNEIRKDEIKYERFSTGAENFIVDAGNFDFVWENKGEFHEIDPNKKYLLYYRGMFGPPTRGHFSVVERFAKYPNVKVAIVQIGTHYRHGVSYWLNKKIWEFYINELLPADRVMLIRAKHFDIHDHLDDIDTILYVRGWEDNLHDNEKRYAKKHRRWVKDVDMEFLFMDRDPNGVSASKFIQALISYRWRKISIEKVFEFMPDNLDKGIKRYIVEELIKMNLH